MSCAAPCLRCTCLRHIGRQAQLALEGSEPPAAGNCRLHALLELHEAEQDQIYHAQSCTAMTLGPATGGASKLDTSWLMKREVRDGRPSPRRSSPERSSRAEIPPLASGGSDIFGN